LKNKSGLFSNYHLYASITIALWSLAYVLTRVAVRYDNERRRIESWLGDCMVSRRLRGKQKCFTSRQFSINGSSILGSTPSTAQSNRYEINDA
jgi:hypothetical protein